MLVFSLSRVTFFFHIHLVHPTPVLACAYICLACLVLPTVLFNPCKVTCIVLCLALRPLCCIYEYLPHCIHALCFAFPFSWLRVTYVGLAICKLGDQTHNTLRLQTQTYSHDNPLLLPPLPSFLLLDFPSSGGRGIFCLPHQVLARRRRLHYRHFRAGN